MHYTVGVILNGSQSLEEILAPFDENIKVPHYITKQEIIDEQRKSFERYRDTTYAEYLKNPEEYIKNHSNHESHIKYLTEDFPKKFDWSDEDFYKEGLAYYDEDRVQPDGSVCDTHNPNSKWDWYQIGGRWSGKLKIKYDEVGEEEDYTSDWAKIKHIDFSPDEDGEPFCTYAVITANGQWHSPGEMHWFSSSETDDEWEDWEKNYVDRFIKTADPEWEFCLVDLHI